MKNDMKVITFFNAKGGAAKTVSAVNFAYALVKEEKKVLLIDSDVRSPIQVYLGLEEKDNLHDLIVRNFNFEPINIKNYISNKNGLDVIASSPNLNNLPLYFADNGDREEIFNCFKNLKQYFRDYEYVIIDTEGTINDINIGILNATDYIMTPTKTTQIDLNGIVDVIQTYKRQKRKNESIKFAGIFLADVNNRTKVHKKSKEDLKQYLDSMEINFFETDIRHDNNIVNAMESELDVINYNYSSNSSIDYRNLADEFLNLKEE